MERIKDFETFYKTKLLHFINDLELQRNEAGKWSFAGTGFILLAICCFFIYQVVAGIVFSILIFFSFYKYTKKKEAFDDNYKKTIINEIINFINPGLSYKPDTYVSSKEYRASGLYRYKYNNYDGDDYIEGDYKNVNFHCSEIETSFDSYQDVPLRSIQNGNSLIIFKGLFFVARINYFKGGTYIWNRGDEQLAVSIMDEHYRLFSLPRVYRIKVAHEQFNKYFSVYSTYPAEAEVLLNQEMLQRITDFRKQLDRDIRISVVAGKFYVAIPVEENLLEPSPHNLKDKEKIKNYFFSILLILSIINQLRLSRFTG